MTIKHWQDPVSIVLGLWLAASPWALGFQAETNPTSNAVLLGILVTIVALFALFGVEARQAWANIVLGTWLVVSPWLIGFSGLEPALWNAVIVGAAIAVLALWALATDRDVGGWSPAT